MSCCLGFYPEKGKQSLRIEDFRSVWWHSHGTSSFSTASQYDDDGSWISPQRSDTASVHACWLLDFETVGAPDVVVLGLWQ